jgi:hypothetical protein
MVLLVAAAGQQPQQQCRHGIIITADNTLQPFVQQQQQRCGACTCHDSW